MKAPLRSTALGLLLLSVLAAACIDVDDAVDQFCLKKPDACQGGAPDTDPDGIGSQDGGGPDGGDSGSGNGDGGSGNGDSGSDAGTDGGLPDAGSEPPGWKSVEPMRSRRMGHTATELNDGRVLVVGGSSSGSLPTNTTELYTLSLNTWSPRRNLGTARMCHSATLLENGKVLVVGGQGPTGEALSSAEIYDAEKDEWTPASPLPNGARASHAAVLLPSGRVLVAGGGDSENNGLNTAAVYNPDDDSWTTIGNLNVRRNTLTLTLLDGDVVVAIGGFNRFGAIASAEVYDTNRPDEGWRLLPERMGHGRNGHASTLLPSGRVLVTGSLLGSPGTVIDAVESFDPVSERWIPQENMKEVRFVHTATVLPSGEVLVAGGNATYDGTPHASAEIFRQDGRWEFIAPMSSERAYHTATWLKSGSVLIVGGIDSHAVSNTAERYVP